jgi:hypothetical protein
MRSTSRPSLNISIDGMLCTEKRDAVIWFASTSSFPTRTRPLNSAASCSTTGAIILHGPHQAAQKSTNTGSGERSTSAAKFASVITIGFVSEDKALWHLPQTAPVRETSTRFAAPHCEHLTTCFSAAAAINLMMPIRDAVVAAKLEGADRNKIKILDTPVQRFDPLARITKLLQQMILVGGHNERLAHDDVTLLS